MSDGIKQVKLIDPALACLYVSDSDGKRRITPCSLCSLIKRPKAMISDKTKLQPVCADCCKKNRVPTHRMQEQPEGSRPAPPPPKPSAPKTKPPKTERRPIGRPKKYLDGRPAQKVKVDYLGAPPLSVPKRSEPRSINLPNPAKGIERSRRCKAAERTLNVQFGCLIPRRVVGLKERESIFECDCTCSRTGIPATGASLRSGKTFTCGDLVTHEADLRRVAAQRNLVRDWVIDHPAQTTETIAEAVGLSSVYVSTLLAWLVNHKKLIRVRPVVGCPYRIWANNDAVGAQSLAEYKPSANTDPLLNFIQSNPGCLTNEILDALSEPLDCGKTQMRTWLNGLFEKGLLHIREIYETFGHGRVYWRWYTPEAFELAQAQELEQHHDHNIETEAA